MISPMRRLLAAALLLATACAQQPPDSAPAPPQSDPLSPAAVRARVEREWTVKAGKMRTHLLPLMRKHKIDLWAIMSRENAPDPVIELFGGHGLTGWYGHRNAYLFHDAGDAGLQTTVIGTHLSQHLKAFYGTIQSYGEEGLKPHLVRYLSERKPRMIAINQSRTISMGDGLTAELKDYLLDALRATRGDGQHLELVTSSEPLLVDYVSVHTPEEDAIETEAAVATWEILQRAFSNEVITPGRTRLMDVHYWITAERKRRNFEFNFAASLDLQRFRDGKVISLDDADDPVIERGDVLHVDFGVRQSGIVTDQQKMGYVLRDGESAPPPGLVRAFADSVKGAEIHAAEIVAGRTGHEIKVKSEAAGKAAGLDLLVYSHVQGYWVHDAGPWTVFDWPERYGIHPREVLQGGEWFSVEFRTRTAVPEWGNQLVSMQREEDAITSKTAPLRYLVGPQTELWIVK
jgi:hypothetical protein